MYKLNVQGYHFAISSITTYELLRGDNLDEDRYWNAMFSAMKILPFDLKCAEQAAKIYKTLKRKGLLIEAEDLLIGATALSNSLKLVTTNIKHFERIQELELLRFD